MTIRIRIKNNLITYAKKNQVSRYSKHVTEKKNGICQSGHNLKITCLIVIKMRVHLIDDLNTHQQNFLNILNMTSQQKYMKYDN